MAENKMEQVAALFGKKLGEEFSVRFDKRYGYHMSKMRFTERGLEYFNSPKWELSPHLNELCEGGFKIVEGENDKQ